MKSCFLLSAIALMGLVAGCQTQQPKKAGPVNDYAISVSSTPSDAAIYLDTEYQGATPSAVYLKSEKALMTVFKPGYTPVEVEVNRSKNQEVSYNLSPVNSYLYELISNKGLRFVKRSNLDNVRLEPSNRPIGENYAFYLKDDSMGKTLRLRIVKLASRYVTLETDEGTSVVLPVIYITDNR